MPGQDGRCVHFLEEGAAIVDLAPRDDLQSFGFRDRVFTTVRLEIADDDIHAGIVQVLSFLQHLVGLPNSGGITHEDLELASRLVSHRYCGKTHTSMPWP